MANGKDKVLTSHKECVKLQLLKQQKDKQMTTSTKELIKASQVAATIARAKGRFFGLTFIKKDGSERTMNVTAVGPRHNTTLPVFDHNIDAWRSCNLARVQKFTCGKDSVSF